MPGDVLERPGVLPPSQAPRLGLPTGDRPASMVAGEGYLVRPEWSGAVDVIAWDQSPTGDDTRLYLVQVKAFDVAAPAIGLLAGITGYARIVLPILEAFLPSEGLLDEAVTGCRVLIRLPASPFRRYSQAAKSLESESLVGIPAARLRQISGLDASRLAELFGVSRVTFQAWTAGATPHGARRERLLEILKLIEEVTTRLGNAQSTADWLLTPVTPKGKKPVELLRDRQDDTFRGYSLRLGTPRRFVRAPRPSRSRRVVAPEELRAAIGRLRSQTGYLEDNPASPQQGAADVEIPDAEG